MGGDRELAPRSASASALRSRASWAGAARAAAGRRARGSVHAPARPAAPGLEPVVASTNLARRAALEADLERAAAERCDVYLTELKAAAIDTVAERAEHEGARVLFVRNRPIALDDAWTSSS